MIGNTKAGITWGWDEHGKLVIRWWVEGSTAEKRLIWPEARSLMKLLIKQTKPDCRDGAMRTFDEMVAEREALKAKKRLMGFRRKEKPVVDSSDGRLW